MLKMRFVFALLGLASATQLVRETRTIEHKLKFWESLKVNSEKVAFKYYPGKGMGLEATDNITLGETILRSPPVLTINPLQPFPLLEHISNLPLSVVLKVRILYEKYMGQTNNFHAEYIHSLPETCNLPLVWTQEEQAFLRSISIYPTSNIIFDILEEYLSVEEALKNARDLHPMVLDYQSYQWAHCVVKSRAFNFNLKDIADLNGLTAENNQDNVTEMLVPFLDMINHSPRPGHIENKYGIKMNLLPTPILGLIADRNISKGSEIVFEYPVHPFNQNLLITYGFVIHNNRFDQFFLSYKTNICYGIKEEDVCTYHIRAGELNTNMLMYLRMVAANLPLAQVRDPYEHYVNLVDSTKETQKSYISALRNYRVNVKLGEFKYGLRELRKMRDEYTENKRLAIDYAMSSMLTRYNHQRLLDSLMLKILIHF